MNCVECLERLQQQLDGQSCRDPLALERHLTGCRSCRVIQAGMQRLEGALHLAAPLAPPPGLNNRIVVAVLADQRAGQRFRRLVTAAALAGCALAASLLLVALLGPFRAGPGEQVGQIAHPSDESVGQMANPSCSPPPDQPDLPEQPERTPAPEEVPSIRDSVARASTAVADLTRQTTTEAVDQTRVLWPVVSPTTPMEDVGPMPPALDPPARSLREAGQGVSAGLEPVTSSARRAVGLFLRDTPPQDSEKENQRGS